jgi:hypothetical protein
MLIYRKKYFLLVFLFNLGCTEEVPDGLIYLPEVKTSEAVEILVDRILIGGEVLNDGGSKIIQKGIVYSKSDKPSMKDFLLNDLSTSEVFQVELLNLDPNTVYYVSAFAVNERGVGYGEVLTIKTAEALPSPPDFPKN